MAPAPDDRWRVRPAAGVDLTAIDPGSTEGAPGTKHETREASHDLRDELRGLQERLWAEQRRSLLVVLQAMDAGGKDGAIKKVFSGVNPQGCRVVSFRAPSEEEREHDFLWRIHRRVPRHGEIGIFNRSHYEDVLVTRVQGLVPEEVWRPRYGHIRAFEELLTDSGTTVVKLMLHISEQEQAERFQKRLDDPEKRWKFRRGDLDDRARWDDFQLAYADAIAETSTDACPWYVIPADHKWFRDFALLTVVVAALRRLDPRFPDPEAGLEDVEVV